jgi:hypothetical protein
MNPVTLTKAHAPQVTAEIARTLARMVHRLEPPDSHRRRFIFWRTRQARIERRLLRRAEQAKYSSASRRDIAHGFREITRQIASMQRLARKQTPHTATHAHEPVEEMLAKSESAAQALLNQVQTARQRWTAYVAAITSGQDYSIEQAPSAASRTTPTPTVSSETVPDGMFGASRTSTDMLHADAL